jgi:hypothetical protein
MAMVCPQCSTIEEQRLQCPRCGARLVHRDPLGLRVRMARWQQTPWGRIVIALMLAQGMFYGLRHLLTGVLLGVSGAASAQEAWGSIHGLLLLQAAQMLSLILAGLIAGGGQQHGMVQGAVVGSFNGVLAVLLRQNPAQGLTTVAVYGQPLLHAAFAALGGCLGSLIWKPLPAQSRPSDAPAPRKGRTGRKRSAFAGPIAWFRVLTGITLAVGGSLSAAYIFDKVLDLGAGRLGTTAVIQDRIITWEIKALALVVGGALAGATTANGLKQGLVVGLFACLILISVEGRHVDRWLELAVFTFISALSLTLVGGWFGSQLFPPVVKHPRRGLGSAMS